MQQLRAFLSQLKVGNLDTYATVPSYLMSMGWGAVCVCSTYLCASWRHGRFLGCDIAPWRLLDRSFGSMTGSARWNTIQ